MKEGYVPTIFEDFKVDAKTILFNSFKTITKCDCKKDKESKENILNLIKETIKDLKKENFDIENIDPSNYEIQLVLAGILLSKTI